jgi:hypothetical protein
LLQNGDIGGRQFAAECCLDELFMYLGRPHARGVLHRMSLSTAVEHKSAFVSGTNDRTGCATTVPFSRTKQRCEPAWHQFGSGMETGPALFAPSRLAARRAMVCLIESTHYGLNGIPQEAAGRTDHQRHATSLAPTPRSR